MSDQVALSLITLIGLIVNIAFSVRTNQKVSACGSKECQDAVNAFGKKT